MQLNKIIKINFFFYFFLAVICAVSLVGDYFLGQTFTKIYKYMFYFYYIFPLFILFVNIKIIVKHNIFLKICSGILQGGIFLFIGYFMLLLVVKIRIALGLGI